MKSHHPRRARQGLRTRAVAVAAGALALTLGASVAASADAGTPAPVAKGQTAHAATPAVSAFSTADTTPDPNRGWSFGLNGRDASGDIWNYPPKSGGGFQARENVGTGFGGANAFFQNNSANTKAVNLYARFGGTLRIYGSATADAGTSIGGGWNIYNAFVTPGNLGGAVNPDLLARDTSGVLWEYLSYANGTFAPRTRIGGGWNIYTQIAGRGDLTGDGRADIVARDKAGVLWLYKGTGNWRAPFAPRTKIGGGWNAYNKLVALGDNNGDGLNDLLARDAKGNLFIYQGTGHAAAPFKAKVSAGWGWNSYNYLF